VSGRLNAECQHPSRLLFPLATTAFLPVPALVAVLEWARRLRRPAHAVPREAAAPRPTSAGSPYCSIIR
jgi:hypothetical protein